MKMREKIGPGFSWLDELGLYEREADALVDGSLFHGGDLSGEDDGAGMAHVEFVEPGQRPFFEERLSETGFH